MMIKLLLALLLALAIGAPVGYVVYETHQTRTSSNVNGSGAHAVPGPLVGAGLPFIAVGYGVYWLVRRRRRAN
jgi:uncharacterized protein HemY